MKNPDILNFDSSLTMNNGKLIRYFRSPLYAIASNIIPFGMREKMVCFELCFTCTDGQSRHLELLQLTGFE